MILMCNLHHLAARYHVECHFRAIVPAYGAMPVGTFGTGLFLRPISGQLQGLAGPWGMIQPQAKVRRRRSRAILTNNARTETVATRPTYCAAWVASQRCLIPASWYQQPNWQTGRSLWWRLTRADGEPLAIVGLWSEWTDPATGDIDPSFTLLDVNCDSDPRLGRLHTPDSDRPADAQDKRSILPLAVGKWSAWFGATPDEALRMLLPPPMARFDLADPLRTNRLLGQP